MGIAHRGRMNVLVNILEYPAKDLFYKIAGHNDIPEDIYNW
jgi:probable 2-oxoglutarate dehydrogenase E1 component DHKTD1